MENLELWNKVREVPEAALKKINGGRLNGMTDINPVWRIKTLTENFGICGIGWRYEITKMWTEKTDKETAAFVNINLYIKNGETWSEAIPGTGGSKLAAAERSGIYTDDECYKKALTDALSVACKALGIGADVYFSRDATKYNSGQAAAPPPNQQTEIKCPKCGRIVQGMTGRDNVWRSPQQVLKECGGICPACYRTAKNGT